MKQRSLNCKMEYSFSNPLNSKNELFSLFCLIHKSNQKPRYQRDSLKINSIIEYVFDFMMNHMFRCVFNGNINRMFRAIRTNNKICLDKDLKRSWQIHEQKLRQLRSTVSKDRPPTFAFLNQRQKKQALEEVRNIEIEKENQSLLDKIQEIGHRGSKSTLGRFIEKQQKKKTLNEPFRKRELVKIVEENQDLMKRIQMKKSQYNVRKWMRERKEVQKNITLISEFPYKNYPCTQTKVNLWMTAGNFNEKSRVDQNSKSFDKHSPTNLVYSGTQKINQSYYLVETYLNRKIFNIEVQNLENCCQKYRIQLDEEEAHDLVLKKFDGQLRSMASCLQIDREKREICLNLQKS